MLEFVSTMSNEIIDGEKSEFVPSGKKLVTIIPSKSNGGATHHAVPLLSDSQFDLKQTIGRARNLIQEIRKHFPNNN